MTTQQLEQFAKAVQAAAKAAQVDLNTLHAILDDGACAHAFFDVINPNSSAHQLRRFADAVAELDGDALRGPARHTMFKET